ncbi:MAG: hypothetical protein R3233_04145 [Xanthomonadales bacterium]|nr:hypothetical protein [Xanthomonadales bacterium]
MKRSVRRLLLLAPLLVVLLLAGAYLLLDAWLEGAGGRRAVENALAERLNMPVNLNGRFDVMLLPAIGVSGTDLVIGAPGAASEAARSGRYAVALALLPLLDGQLLIESFELEDGTFYFERWAVNGEAGDAGGTAAALQLPEIRAFSVRDFDIHAGKGEPVHLQRFAVEDFAAGAAAPFELAVAGFGEMAGELNWNASRQELGIDADWSDLLPGTLRVQAVAGLGLGRGSAEAAWAPAGVDPATAGLRLAFAYGLVPEGVRLDDLRLEAGSQAVSGDGCVLAGEPIALHLDLTTPAIDFDALPDLAALGEALEPPAGDVSQGTDSGPALVLNLRLRADEARLQGALARQAELGMGGAPDCDLSSGAPDDSPQLR